MDEENLLMAPFQLHRRSREGLHANLRGCHFHFLDLCFAQPLDVRKFLREKKGMMSLHNIESYFVTTTVSVTWYVILWRLMSVGTATVDKDGQPHHHVTYATINVKKQSFGEVCEILSCCSVETAVNNGISSPFSVS